MKKLLFIALLAVMSGRAYSQNLQINNWNQVCTVFVWLHAVDHDPAWGNFNGCDIYSNMITIPPSSNPSWANINAFNGGPGFSFFTTWPPALYFTTTTTFSWTDATYQWRCPLPCLGNGGGNMSDPITMPICYPAPMNISGSCYTGGGWNNLTGIGVMDDVELNFN